MRPARTLYSRLRLVALIGGAACFLFSAAAVFQLQRIDRAVGVVANASAHQGAPALELMAAAEQVALRVAHYNRSRNDGDRTAAMEEFERALRRVGAVRIALAASPGATPTMDLARTTTSRLLAWRAEFGRTSEFVLRSERSTRGLASQCSLLSTLAVQLVTDDGSVIAGPRAPAHRSTCLEAVSALADIQNSILFASSLLDPEYVGRALLRQAKLAEALHGLTAATTPSDLREFLTEVEGRVKDLGDELVALRLAIEGRNESQAVLLRHGDATLAPLQPLVASTTREAVSTSAAVSHRLHRTLATIALAALLVPCGSILAGHRLARRIRSHLSPMAARLTEAAHVTAEQSSVAERDTAALAANAEEAAAAIQQLSATAAEMNRTAAITAGHTNRISRLAAGAHESATHGRGSVAEMGMAMRDIVASGEKITSIVKSIDEIAFQTNLLALNAAIEAARAGESGRGFAVVADEVRRLAQRSASAARETAELVENAQARTQRGVDAAQGVERDFQTITDQVAEVQLVLRETSASAEKQTREVQTMTAALDQLRAGTTEASAQAARLAQFAATLREQSNQADTSAAALGAFLGLEAAQPAATRPSCAPARVGQPLAA